MIILASASAARRTLLEKAGVDFTVYAADIDEDAVKESLRIKGADAAQAAAILAERKAMRVSERHPGQVVVGADQMLECQGNWFDKPKDRTEAKDQLLALAGRPHQLVSAAAAVKDGIVLWRCSDRADLTMRDFGPDTVDAYLDEAGPAALASVGAYQIEGLGIQLFAGVEGSHSTILGLPLLPLLAFLRRIGEVRA